MARSQKIVEVQEESHSAILEAQLSETREVLQNAVLQNELLQESISGLDLYLDSRGWSAIGGGYVEDGPTLSQLHASSKQIRNLVAMNVHAKRGLQLRTSYVWEGGIHYDGVRGARQGRGVNVQELIDLPLNQRNFFSQSAREEREACLYADSQPFYVGDDDKKTIRSIPIREITGVVSNPDQSDEIWAYRRAWIPQPLDGSVGKEKVEWIFTNRFWDRRVDRITFNQKTESVSKTSRMFGDPVNGMIGWALGVPDALSAIAWFEQYRQYLISGKQMSDAMAKLWAQTKHNSQAGAENAAIKIGGMTSSGGVANVGASNDIQPLATAGQSYDFAKGLPLLAAGAAGLGVSVISLSSNPGNAGGSYGASKSLDRPEMLVTVARRQYHVDLDREVLVWLGADPKKLDVWFDPIVDADQLYRADQRVGIRLGTGLYEGLEIKEMFAANDGKEHVTPVPKGWLIPNNKESLALKSIDTDVAGGDPANGGSFTPTQGSGQDFGSGGQGDQDASDLRNRD